MNELAELRQQVAELEAKDTERKRAEEALQKSQQLLERMFASLRDAVFIVDADTTEILDCNPAASKIFGYSRQEMLGRTTAFLHVDEVTLAEFRKHLYPAVAEKGFLFLPEFRMKRKDGTVFPTEHSMVPLADAQGKRIGWVSVVRDITARKRAEEALQFEREQLLSIFESIDEIIYASDPNTHEILFANKTLREAFGKDLVGGICYREFQGFDSPCEFCTNEIILREKGKPYRWEYHNPILDRHYAIVDRIIRWPDGRDVRFEFAVDITERKRAEEKVCRYLERIEALREIEKATTSTLDLTQVLDIILEELKRVIPYHSAGIFLFSDGKAKLTAGMGFPDLERALQVSFPVEEDALTCELLQDKCPLVLADAQADERFRARGGTEYVRSWIGVPLISKGKSVGILTIDHREPGVYDEESADMARAFASQVAIAIENARLYEEARQELAERERAEEELRRSEERFRSLIENMSDLIVILNADGTARYVSPSTEQTLGYKPDETIGKNISEFIHPDDLPNWINAFAHRLQHPGAAETPMEARVRHKDGSWRVIEGRGNNLLHEPAMAGVVINARDITKRKRAEEKVRHHLEQIEALREIDKAIISTLDLTEVLDIILKELERVIPYHSAAIFLLSDDTARVTAGRGFPDMERALQVSFPVEEDALTRELLQEKRPLVLTDAQADERFLARGGTEYVRSWIGVPLIAREKVVGFLTIDHREPGVYGEESAEMAEAFASQVAVAVENARLYEEAQRELAERKRAQEELARTTETLRKTLGATIQAMAVTVETRDAYTAGHQRRVADLARAIATEMGLPKERIEGLRMAAVIHDIGKIAVPTDILNKPARLSENEFGIIKDHPRMGYDILKEIEFPWPIAQIIFQHHERMDGSGYPRGLSGEDILLEARILAVADMVEAMASHRPYRPAHGIDKALEEISQNRGVLYDPGVVDACLRLFTEKGFTFNAAPPPTTRN